MNPEEASFAQRFKWHIATIVSTVVIVLLLALFTNIWQSSENVRDMVFLFGALVFLSALLATLSKVIKIVDTLQDNSSKLEEVTKALENIRRELTQIDQSTRVSETAKAIISLDADRQSLQEAVLEKLKQHDFDAAYKLIDETADRPQYRDLAQQLRDEARKYREEAEQEQISKPIAQINKLLDDFQWLQASTRIEELIKDNIYPDAAKAMRQKLIDKKQQRKRNLLAAWDDAVKRQDTDQSLEILKELDLYLTPNEGLALQEAAKDVFRTKLHNLGVQFSIAVTEKQWDLAVKTGEQITRNFPNSRMAEEIHEKMDVLRQKVESGAAG